MDNPTVNLLITVISGALVFILGQMFMEFVLRPIQEYKKLKAEIASKLVYYTRNFCSPINRCNNTVEDVSSWNEGEECFRTLASKLEGFSEIKPVLAFMLPKKSTLKEASDKLIGLSNSFFYSGDEDKEEHRHGRQFSIEAKRLLKIGDVKNKTPNS